MSARFIKTVPEFVYMEAVGSGWFAGLYVHPKAGRKMRKFQLVEVPMDPPKTKKPKKKKAPSKGNPMRYDRVLFTAKDLYK
jgi:hypothetical protein